MTTPDLKYREFRLPDITNATIYYSLPLLSIFEHEYLRENEAKIENASGLRIDSVGINY